MPNAIASIKSTNAITQTIKIVAMTFIILVALIFVLRIVSKSNLRQNQQLVIKVIATILIVCVIAFVLFIDAIAFGIIGPVQD